MLLRFAADALVMMSLVATAKSLPWLNNFFRRNPVLYPRHRRLLQHLYDAEPAGVRQWQAKRLQQVLAWVAGTRYGRLHGRLQTLQDLPVLEKARIRGRRSDFIRPWVFPKIAAATGGSSGIPLALSRSMQMVTFEQAAIDFCCTLCGVDPTVGKVAVLRGDVVKSPDDRSPPFSRQLAAHTLILSAYHINAASVRYYVEDLKRFQPDCLLAYPSALEALLNHIDRIGAEVHVPLIMTSSEILADRTRRLAERLLQAMVLDHYGQAERVALAYSCKPGQYYFLPGYGHVELAFVRAEPEYDIYEIVATSLWNAVMPLARYRTGDFARLPKNLSAADREAVCLGKQPFLGIEGREDNFILSPEGRRIVAMDQIVRDIKNIAQMQIIQERVDQVMIHVVPLKAFGEPDRQRIVANARAKVPQSMEVVVRTVAELEKTTAGKTPSIIRHVGAEPD